MRHVAGKFKVSSETNRVKMALVGVGSWGIRVLATLQKLNVCSVFAAVDPDPRARRRAQQGGVEMATLDEVLASADVDAVVIASPPSLHTEHARRALLAGKDVFVEKPLAFTAKDAMELELLAARRGRVLSVGHVLLYHPMCEALLVARESGRLGGLRGWLSERSGAPGRMRHEDSWWTLAPHDIALLITLFGRPSRLKAARVGEGRDNSVSCDFGFDSGVEAHIAVSTDGTASGRRVALRGAKSSFLIEDCGATLRSTWMAGSVRRFEDVADASILFSEVSDSGEPLLAELAEFCRAVQTRGTTRTGPAHAVLVTELLELGDWSARHLETVDLRGHDNQIEVTESPRTGELPG